MTDLGLWASVNLEFFLVCAVGGMACLALCVILLLNEVLCSKRKRDE